MKRLLLILALILGPPTLLWAADNFTAQTPSGQITVRAKDTGSSILSSQVTVQDSNNAALISCTGHIYKHITSATDTVAVQGVTSQVIYICGYRATFAGTATVFLENTASTNNNCSSTLTQIAPVESGVANTQFGFISAYWTGLKNTSGNGLCINSTGTGGVDVEVWYQQF